MTLTLQRYRPENWDWNGIRDRALEAVGWDKEGTGYEEQLVEVGADAMLDALFKMAKESPTGTFVIDSRGINV